MARNPGFAAVMVLVLALGIGANTAIFTLVNSLVLRPLPFPEPEELVLLNETSPRMDGMSVAYPNFLDWREQNEVFDAIAAMANENYNLTGLDQPTRVRASLVSAGLFEMLGARPTIGRFFEAADDRPEASPVVVLSYAFWAAHFGQDPQVLDTTVRLDGKQYTVVGVAPPGFKASLDPPDLYLPIGLNGIRWRFRGSHNGISAIARLKDGVDVETARENMAAISQRLAEAYPDTNTGNGVRIRRLDDAAVGSLRAPLFLLLATVGAVLLIACCNITNLLLARATSRRPEIAVRAAIGASRGRVIRQLLTESLVLASLGGVLSFLTGWAFLRGLVAVVPEEFRQIADVTMDPRVFAFAAGVCLLTGLLFGLAPAFAGSRVNLSTALKEGGRGGAGRRGSLRSLLIISEVAVAAVLLLVASLLMHSFSNIIHADPGYDPRNRLAVSFSMPETDYTGQDQQIRFVRQLIERVDALPEVEAAGVATPLLGHSQTGVYVEGTPIPKPGQMDLTDIGRVSPGYLDAMGIRLLKGRYFTDHDTAESQLAVIVDERFADRYWSGDNPIGKRVKLGPPDDEKAPWFEVVGVVRHVKNYGVDHESRMELYAPFYVSPVRETTLVVHAASNPAALGPVIGRQVREIDARMPVYDVHTMEDYVSESVAPTFLVTALLGAFAAAALLLAAIGLYGLMSYSVVERYHEIGVRIALGAGRGRVLGTIIAQGSKLAAIGLVIGLAVSFPLASLLGSMLFGVKAQDAGTFLAVGAALLTVAIIATFIPARRASLVDPQIALRHE